MATAKVVSPAGLRAKSDMARVPVLVSLVPILPPLGCMRASDLHRP